MPLTIAQSTPSVGMNLNDDPLSFKEGDYGFTLNAFNSSIDTIDKILGIMPGNIFKTALPSGFYPIGNVKMNDDRVVIFSVSPSLRNSEIGVFKHGVYLQVVRDPKLNFQITRPIDGESKGNRVYFTDDNEPPRYLDLDKVPYINGELDTDKMRVFADYLIPQLKVTAVNENGALRSGTYFFCGQYATRFKTGITAFTTPVGPLVIFKDSISGLFDDINGSESDVVTTKSVRLSLENLDKSFEYLNICAIRQINGVKRAFVVATVSTQQKEYVYTGFGNDQIELSIADVIVPAVSYETAKCVSRSSNLLLFGNLTSKKIYNLQPYVRNFRMQWQSYRVPATDINQSYKHPIFGMYKRSYRAGEVQPYGFVVLWKDGTKSPVYPLVARRKNKTSAGDDITQTLDQYGNTIPLGTWDSFSGLSGEDVFETDAPERWKTFSTATVEGFNSTGVFGNHRFGEMGYYESTDTYPNISSVWGDLAGTPILHPRYPDRSVVLLQDEEPSITGENKTALYLLGLRIPNLEEVINSFPTEVKEKMQGWEIVAANREFDSSIVASGLLHNVRGQNWDDEIDKSDIRLYPNFPLNDLRDDFFTVDMITGPNGRPEPNIKNPYYRKDVFNFYSPDTSFQRKFIQSTQLMIDMELSGEAELSFDYVEPYTGFKINNNNDFEDTAVHGLAIGKYRNVTKMKYGNVRREVKEALYVGFNAESSGGNIGNRLHNRTRESTVYLKTGTNIKNPSVFDTSRGQLNDVDIDHKPAVTRFSDYDYDFYNNVNPNLPRFNHQIAPQRLGSTGGTIRYFNKDSFNSRTTSAYYVTLKNFISNQFGPVDSIKWNYTNHNYFNTTSSTVIFGGDTFITEFSLKKQLVFFKNAQQYKDIAKADDVDLLTPETIPHTRYWYYLVGNAKEHAVQSINKSPNGAGYVPLIYTGIPVFYVESSINTFLRHNGQAPWETYYSNLNDGAIDVREWSGIEHVNKDNDFRYNSDYSIVNDVYAFRNVPFSYDPAEPISDHPTRVIVSLASDPEQLFDNWIVFKPNNYYDLPEVSRELWDIRYLGGLKTMFRCTNHIYIDSVYSQIGTSDGELTLGTGQLFQRKPIEIIESEDGFTGTQSQWAFNSTKHGHFLLDTKNGSVFRYSESPTVVSGPKQKVSKWFKKHARLKLLDQMPSFPHFDNAQNPEGIGFLSVYDPLTELWILTKKDYSLVHPEDARLLNMKDGRLHLDFTPVSLSDTSIFRNESFTIGYNPETDRWISFYSFLPTFYFSDSRFFFSVDSSRNDFILYEHSMTTRPRVFYEKRHPFIVDLVYNQKDLAINSPLSATFLTKAMDATGTELPLSTFNKAVFSNNNQCTGEVPLSVVDENDLRQLAASWSDTSSISLRRNDGLWALSGLYDAVKDKSKPLFTTEWSLIKDRYFIDQVVSPSNYEIVPFGKETRFQGMWLRGRYILDSDIDIQLFLYFTYALQKQSVTV